MILSLTVGVFVLVLSIVLCADRVALHLCAACVMSERRIHVLVCSVQRTLRARGPTWSIRESRCPAPTARYVKSWSTRLDCINRPKATH
eukprot:5432993-Prymnesium_polylepis.1